MEKIKLLIAEDDKVFQQIYDFSLSGDVFEKRLVGDGKLALEQYASWHPDLVVLDIVMPTLSGYEVLSEIRIGKEDNSTPVIMSTSKSKVEDMKDCLKLGIIGYVIKPFDADGIAMKILEYYEKVDPEKARSARALQNSTIDQWQKDWDGGHGRGF